MGTRILLTGFKPFGRLAANPTELLMGALEDEGLGVAGPEVEVERAVLEVDYVAAERQFREAVARVRPDVILSFGVSGGTDALCLERIAVNLDDAALPDAAGRTRRGTRIVEEGPAAYWATLDLAALHAALSAAGLPVRCSNHAGTYLCNHVFYYGLHYLQTEGLETRMGFVHVPPLPEQVREGGGAQVGLGLAGLVDAAGVCVGVVARAIAGARVCPEPGSTS